MKLKNLLAFHSFGVYITPAIIWYCFQRVVFAARVCEGQFRLCIDREFYQLANWSIGHTGVSQNSLIEVWHQQLKDLIQLSEIVLRDCNQM